MEKKTQTDSISIKSLLEAKVHFGHQKQRWNPKMKGYIFGERDGSYIIDLAKTMQQIRIALKVVQDVVKSHQSILFVGTKKQAKDVIKDCAERCEEFYVVHRWLGGMLTNLATIKESVKTLERIEKQLSGGAQGFTKKEMTLLNKEKGKLSMNLSGIRSMKKRPGLLVVVDPSNEHIAVAEANKLGIPVMALVDTNSDPDPIDYVIPCNDDALKSIQLIIDAIGDAVLEAKKTLNRAVDKEKTEEESLNLKGEDKK